VVKRFLPIFLALFATSVAIGLLQVITRTGAGWPRSIRVADWRRIIGTPPEEETVSVETPAD
jgi:hypothetical protein